jgi:hypothetical protein
LVFLIVFLVLIVEPFAQARSNGGLRDPQTPGHDYFCTQTMLCLNKGDSESHFGSN